MPTTIQVQPRSQKLPTGPNLIRPYTLMSTNTKLLQSGGNSKWQPTHDKHNFSAFDICRPDARHA